MSERNILILFATETGNAQDAADYVARQCRRIAFTSTVTNMDAYSLPELVSEETVLFIISTTGSGAEPRSMTTLWNMLLRSDLPTDLFEDLSFAVFGLGDATYEKFCWPSKLLSRRMRSLSALEICERGEGDEQHPLGIDGALEPWTDTLINTLLRLFPLPPGKNIISSTILPPPRVVLVDATPGSLKETKDPLDIDRLFHSATVKLNKRITADDWFQDVRHFKFELEDDVKYAPGDVAVIHTVASAEEVDAFINTMGWSACADEPMRIVHNMMDQSLPDHLPQFTTLRRLFSRYLDFNAVPRRTFFQFLQHFTSDEQEREKLEDFLSIEGADDLYEYCFRVRRTIKEVLADFRYVKVPKNYIFDIFPALRAREFSIASSVKKQPHTFELCVAIVRYKTKLRVPRVGICTSYLSRLQPGETLRIAIKRGMLTLPPDICTPVICIGPGTGVAPMKAVIEDRVEQGSHTNTLYFGCRSAAKDQHYCSEWQMLSDRQQLTYRAAFSRDNPEGMKRTYVQDLIQEDAKRIWNLVEVEKAWIYISGSSNKMPTAVKAAITNAVELYGGRTTDEAKTYLDALMKEGRLFEECWS